MDRIKIFPEREARGELRDIYRAIKKELGFAWVPTVFQAFGLYPDFMRLFWQQIGPIGRDRAVEYGAAQILRRAGERVAEELHPERDIGFLLERPRFRSLPLFHQELMPFYLGGPRIFVILTRVREWFTGACPGANYGKARLKRLPYPNEMARVVRIIGDQERREAAELFDRIRRDLHAPVTNNAYRSLARSPEFLGPAWNSVRQHFDTPAYKSIQSELRDAAGAWAREMPPTPVTAEQIRDLPDMDPYSFRLLALTVDAFDDLFPSLAINTTYWSQQLHAARSGAHPGAAS